VRACAICWMVDGKGVNRMSGVAGGPCHVVAHGIGVVGMGVRNRCVVVNGHRIIGAVVWLWNDAWVHRGECSGCMDTSQDGNDDGCEIHRDLLV
jgi:hypothetical protein